MWWSALPFPFLALQLMSLCLGSCCLAGVRVLGSVHYRDWSYVLFGVQLASFAISMKSVPFSLPRHQKLDGKTTAVALTIGMGVACDASQK